MPVTPRDASSLVLFKGDPDRPLVLMGRRREDLRFMPGYYVFPGGTVDPTDAAIANGLPIHPAVRASLSRHAVDEMVPALVWAAIRETWEETDGFFAIRQPFEPASTECEAAAVFSKNDVTPNLAGLEFIARAVTPKGSPMRFDSRFFLADGEGLVGEIRSTGELEDVGWIRADLAVATLPMAHITRFVMARGLAIWSASNAEGTHTPKDRPIPCFTQTGDRFAMVEDMPGDAPQHAPDSLKWPD